MSWKYLPIRFQLKSEKLISQEPALYIFYVKYALAQGNAFIHSYNLQPAYDVDFQTHRHAE